MKLSRRTREANKRVIAAGRYSVGGRPQVRNYGPMLDGSRRYERKFTIRKLTEEDIMLLSGIDDA